MALARAAARRAKEAQALEAAKESAVEVTEIIPGDGVHFPKSGDEVSIHYITWTEDEVEIDNSYKRGKPITFILGSGVVIQGWEETIPSFSIGQRSRLVVPAALAYGEPGIPPVVAGNTKMIFELELVNFGAEKISELNKRMK